MQTIAVAQTVLKTAKRLVVPMDVAVMDVTLESVVAVVAVMGVVVNQLIAAPSK